MFSTFAQQINTRLNTLAEQELFVTLPGDDLMLFCSGYCGSRMPGVSDRIN